MIIPEECIPLLKEQRTSLQHVDEYTYELSNTFDSFRKSLPAKVKSILDIGSGMSGIDVFLSKHYNHSVDITLADKHGVSEKILSGFSINGNSFSYYNDFELALKLLETNGVPRSNIIVHNLLEQEFPKNSYDIVISLLSWGFHYPIHDYFPSVNKGGVIIADCRKGTDGIKKLRIFGECKVVYEAQKYHRVLCQC